MPWIESHQDIERHPKTLQLASLMGWSLDETIGKLHRLWYWAMDYAEDGNLERYDATVVAGVVGTPLADSQRLVESLCISRFCDDSPFRIHDWWDYAGRFLQVKYKAKPSKWKKIRGAYLGRCKNPPKNCSKPQDLLPNLLPNQKIKEEKIKYGDFVFLTRTEYAKLFEKIGEQHTIRLINALDAHIGSKGKQTAYKSHYHTILAWAEKDGVKAVGDPPDPTKFTSDGRPRIWT